VGSRDGGYREALLRPPPFRYGVVTPHVTIVHPRTSRRGRECWNSGEHTSEDVEFLAAAVAITAFDGTRWATLATFPLKA